MGLLSLSIAAAAMAEDTATAVADVVTQSSGLPFGLQAPEIVLLLTPLVGYALYKTVIVPKVRSSRGHIACPAVQHHGTCAHADTISGYIS